MFVLGAVVGNGDGGAELDGRGILGDFDILSCNSFGRPLPCHVGYRASRDGGIGGERGDWTDAWGAAP